jgi:hypothetical protein
MNLARWAREIAEPGKTYVVKTGQHFVTVRDGVGIDQYEINPIEQHGSRRCFVKIVMEVL